MFPALEKELSKNPLFRAWKEKSIFADLMGPPPILQKEFGDEWIEKLKKIIGEGPLTSYFLTNIGYYIENIKNLKGYKKIKNRLKKLDDRLYPTLSEIEFLNLLMCNVPEDKIHLEYTFKTLSGKHPEFKVDYNKTHIFFEVTNIRDYREMSTILNYYNLFTGFQLALKILFKTDAGIIIKFFEYPNEMVFNTMLQKINNNFSKGEIYFEEWINDNLIKIYRGNEIEIIMPTVIIEN